MAGIGRTIFPTLLLAPSTKRARPRKTVMEKATTRRILDKARAKTRVNIGSAFQRWRQLRQAKGMKSDTLLAEFLLDRYFESHPQDRLISNVPNKSSARGSEKQEDVSSSSEEEKVNPADLFFPLSQIGKEFQVKHPNGQKLLSGDKDIKAEEPKSRGFKKDADKFKNSLTVGDGHHLVDLGSSSEFVVQEECILQLFRTCRACSRHCTVRKQVKGLQLVVSQVCCYCNNLCQWTNLPDDGDSAF
ncbi:uncharacterized protein LOC141805591 isoform X1 [Halichoeres trimaculatus]|uniref:uncharacterized protein LOC141805591 isoform X1 n=1 Tax=Halichoeres trimaculatus TaxID=147232 RepID=UPI003D9E965C